MAAMKQHKRSTNTICVKQPTGKDFTIVLPHPPDSSQNNKPKITLTAEKDCGPVCIIIHSTPKNNVKVSLVGDTLLKTIGNPKTIYPSMLLKGGGRGYSSHHNNSISCTGFQDQHSLQLPDQYTNPNLSNDVKLSMPGSGVNLNMKIEKENSELIYNKFVSDFNDFETKNLNCESNCKKTKCSGNNIDNARLCLQTKYKGYHQPTISSLIATRLDSIWFIFTNVTEGKKKTIYKDELEFRDYNPGFCKFFTSYK
ncbi:hypothetical protein KC19_3G219500 [Ceratodon purpureus]|uniref:Uncharacterized protein n=1 Tax=Ceratodon purpureus TaxID=3225 RepID=A0A8T0INL3_CERPU|nr:hypothetical protein KC19_3G219500 [Ceratodon purpureus]